MATSYKKLFKLLIDRDMKKKEFTEKAGISIATITKMKKDGAVVSSDVLVKICTALGCTLDDIVEIDPEKAVKLAESGYGEVEHVAIFDETQRSWTHKRLADYLKSGGTYGNKLKERYDMPWIDTEFDPNLKKEIEEFPSKNLPTIYALIDKYKDGKTIVIFKSREQADAFLNGEKL